jgi:hypothetical protein
MENKITVPNNVPDKYKKKLVRFIEHAGGVFGAMYYNPLRARIVNPDNFTTMYIVNLENGKICVPRKGVPLGITGNLTLDGFLSTKGLK